VRNLRHAASIVGLFTCSYAALATAHDFWLQPSQYWVAPDALTSLTLQVGHGPFRQRSPIPARRIVRIQAIDPAGMATDLHGQLEPGQATQDGEFRLKSPGSHVLVLQTDDAAQTHLPAIRFNDYLKAEGLTPALEQRARLQRTAADGSERYSRCAKSLVQAGAAAADTDAQITTPVGLPLEIVPEANPYDAHGSASLPVRVIYEGRPLAGALVKLTNLQDDASPFEVRLTDRWGRASFTLPTSGTWLLNVIWTKVMSASDEVDFETVFSSLSFGFPAKSP
jgi:uncharacterized GH25 family protein